MALLPDLCGLDSECDDDEEDYYNNGCNEDYVFHNPLSLLAAVPDVVDFER